MILTAQELRLLKPVKPFTERMVSHGMTYGVGPAGYDIRVAESIMLPPGGFSLASTIEQFNISANVIAFVHDKSTWARKGLAVQNTVLEPGWRGYLTLELSNHSQRPIEILAGMPIAQVIFHKLTMATDAPYNGKYQNQEAGAQAARFDK